MLRKLTKDEIKVIIGMIVVSITIAVILILNHFYH